MQIVIEQRIANELQCPLSASSLSSTFTPLRPSNRINTRARGRRNRRTFVGFCHELLRYPSTGLANYSHSRRNPTIFFEREVTCFLCSDRSQRIFRSRGSQIVARAIARPRRDGISETKKHCRRMSRSFKAIPRDVLRMKEAPDNHPTSERSTAPQSPSRARDILIGFGILVLGFVIAFGIPVVLAGV